MDSARFDRVRADDPGFVDVAFLISNYFKKERRGKNTENDVLYAELGGRTPKLQ